MFTTCRKKTEVNMHWCEEAQTPAKMCRINTSKSVKSTVEITCWKSWMVHYNRHLSDGFPAVPLKQRLCVLMNASSVSEILTNRGLSPNRYIQWICCCIKSTWLLNDSSLKLKPVLHSLQSDPSQNADTDETDHWLLKQIKQKKQKLCEIRCDTPTV